ncbi:hypothetical protein EV649_5249 [Kribbella sp. VKM Ac-2569]|uniref:hypothetical protein n=1 Tax=Kribbella sp. VKM Ac-2569 TaxID=2512220 RepID=UPI00102B49BB|nr:hypothetical protein [Kribbella sp. VKM Ac-2569]RZT17692.1 hypothetical protein EV649_5249 [Kribbella sp. VKM Ac-2569]
MNAEAGLPVVAITHGVVGLTTCACLIAFFAVGGPFGTINDLGNAVFGVQSLALARFLAAPSHRFLLLGVAVVGAILTVVGTVLVVTEVTGFYLAGLWSSFGFALIGLWLVAVSRHGPTRLRRSGVVAGGVMLLGLVGVPGIPMGLDDMDNAPAWTFVAGVSWAGTYLLFPVWSLRLAGRDRAERGS